MERLPAPTVCYAREKMADILPELKIITARACAEVGQGDMVFNADWDMYLEQELTGKVFVLTARIDALLIGYNIMLLHTHPHYKDARVAQNDAIFIAPEYRRGKIGIGLIKYFEAAMRSCGFDKIYYHAKPFNGFGKLLEKMGYPVAEIIHAKNLKGGA